MTQNKIKPHSLLLIAFSMVILSSCSVLALTAGKANSTITTSTSTQTIIDSTKVTFNTK